MVWMVWCGVDVVWCGVDGVDGDLLDVVTSEVWAGWCGSCQRS